MRLALMSSCAIVALALAAPALADEAVTEESGDPGEIIVTAQKRDERLQDIPVAASVVGSEILARANASDITDINKLIPSVQLKGTYNGRVPLGIRGISTNANEGAVGLTSGVAIQIDGVPVPPDSFAANALDDIAQVEVLKGPQATLGGRTASAGVINIVTNGPSDVLKGKVSATVTDDNEQRGNLSVSGPITDGVAFSLAGFGSHTTYLVENILDDGKNADSTNYGVRGKLKFGHSDGLSATLMGRFSHFHSDGGTFTHQYLTPGANLFPFIPSAFGPNGPTQFGIPQSVAFPGLNIHYGNTQTASIVKDMFADWKDYDASLTLNYNTDDLSFSSITAYQEEKQAFRQDITLSSLYFFDTLLNNLGVFPPSFNNSQLIHQNVKQLSQEFKVASDVNRPVSFLAGLFYSDNKVISENLRVFVGNPQSFRVFSKTGTYAAYARATFKLGESTSVTAGLRYNHDRLTFQKTQYFDPANGAFMGCQLVSSPTGPSHVGPTCVLPTNHDSSNTLVGDISIQQKFGADSMVYGSYTRGYKPKAYNTAAEFYLPVDNPQNLPISSLTQSATGKEKIDSFEIGLKTKIAGLGTLNVAAFHTVYNNYQVQIFPIVAGGLAPLELSNAGKARTQGIEADFAARIGGRTTVNIAAAYIDAKFLRFQNAPCYGDQTLAAGCAANGTQDLSGKPMPDAPHFKFNIDAEHAIPLSDNADLVLGANFAYRSAAFFQANNNPRTRQPAFGLLNLSAGIDLDGGKYNLTVFANNVTDKFYLTNAEDFFSGLFGPDAGSGLSANDVIGQPARDAHRYIGARVTAKF